MNLPSMLEKCRRDQWKIGDLDWNRRPRPMTRQDEIAIVQYFTDMAGIERLAAALFAEQGRKTEDPVLKEIFESFVADEIRHAQAAQMLADFYDVHKHETYRMSPALQSFAPQFVRLLRWSAPDIANAYVTAGELILDVALLRSLNDFVGDQMSQQAMDLINRDESRHIAIDFYMTEYYASPAYREQVRAREKTPLVRRLQMLWAFANVLFYASPFFREVFFLPMKKIDPTGHRISEALKRFQLLGAKPHLRRSRFSRTMFALQTAYTDSRAVRLLFGRLIPRVMGADPSVVARLYTEAERRHAERASMDQLAEEALQLKYGE